jgi:DNA replication protein DnaC
MSSPSASSTRKKSETNEQVQPSLKSISTKPQTGTGANIVLIGPPGSGKKISFEN